MIPFGEGYVVVSGHQLQGGTWFKGKLHGICNIILIFSSNFVGCESDQRGVKSVKEYKNGRPFGRGTTFYEKWE